MRMDFRSPIAFGDELSAERYTKRCDEALAKQRCRWAVAPDLSVFTPNGLRLASGSAVTLQLMTGAEPNPAQHIRKLVAQGYLLEATSFADGPEAA